MSSATEGGGVDRDTSIESGVGEQKVDVFQRLAQLLLLLSPPANTNDDDDDDDDDVGSGGGREVPRVLSEAVFADMKTAVLKGRQDLLQPLLLALSQPSVELARQQGLWRNVLFHSVRREGLLTWSILAGHTHFCELLLPHYWHAFQSLLHPCIDEVSRVTHPYLRYESSCCCVVLCCVVVQKGDSFLHLAAKTGRLASVEMLLESCATQANKSLAQAGRRTEGDMQPLLELLTAKNQVRCCQ